MAGVTAQKRGDTWRYRFEGAKVDGKRVQISKGGFATKKEALAAGAKALAEYNSAGTIFTPSEISFADYLDFWMKDYCIPNLKPETIAHYEKKIRLHIKPAAGMYKLKALTHSALQGIINDMFDRGYSRNTLVVIKGILTGCLRYAVEPLHYINTSPAAYLRLPSYRAVPKVETRSEPHVYITQDHIAEIFERFPEGTTTHIPMQLGYRCGLRLGEAFAVTWDDVDFGNGTLTVNRQIQWNAMTKVWYITAPKYNSIRQIEMDDLLIDLLRRTKERQEKAEEYFGNRYLHYYENAKHELSVSHEGHELRFVNTREDGGFIQPRTMQHTTSIIHDKLHYPEFDFHSFRHTHATMLAEAGAPPKYVQERLGHKGIDVTMKIYQHLTESISQKGVVALNTIFDK